MIGMQVGRIQSTPQIQGSQRVCWQKCWDPVPIPLYIYSCLNYVCARGGVVESGAFYMYLAQALITPEMIIST